MHRTITRGRALGVLVGALSVAVLAIALPAVAADAVAPTIDVATLAGTADGNANWRRTKPVTLNLSASDDVAVAKLQYSLDNGATYVDVPIVSAPAVTAAVSISQEGNTQVRYRAVDSSGNVSPGATTSTTLSQPSAAGATAIRLASTTGRGAGDLLVIDTGANQESATIGSVVTPNPPSPSPNVLLTAPLANAHAAGAAVAGTQFYRTIGVLIDTFPPVAAWPQIVDGKILQSQTLTPTRTDPRRRDDADVANGSGGTAVRGMWVDGEYAYPFPLALNRLAAGEHTQTLLLQDAAGNAIRYTQTFVVSSSFADLDAVLTQYETNAKTATLNGATAVGATGVRLATPGLYGFRPGDPLVIDTGANAETVTIAEAPSPPPTLATTLVNAAPAGTTAIRLNSRNGIFAGSRLVIDTGASQELVTIGSIVPGVPAAPEPNVILSAPLASDHAAGTATTLVNLVTTAPLALAHASGAPVSSPRPFIPAGTAANLRALLTQARDAATLGNVMSAVDYLQQFNTAVWQQVVPAGPKLAERAALSSASKAIANELLGGTSDTTGTGVTTEAAAGAIRFFWNPTPPTPVPGATYRVLVNGKTGSGQFRHETTVDIEALVQQLGRDHGFDVDIWDPSTGAGTSPGRAAPAGVSLATSPFTDLQTLKQYKTIVFDQNVGRNNAAGVGATLSADEFANLQAYVRDGGGFVAIHGATDAYQNDGDPADPISRPTWYMNLVGAGFTNHGSNQASGIQPDCGACGVVELSSDDPGHPATALIPERFPVIEELYNTNRNPIEMGIVHPLVLENEATLVGQLGYGTGSLMNSDEHGMVWCRNFDGGRSFTSNLGHSPQLMLEPWYQHMILKAIQTTAGVEYGNCVTFFEVRSLISSGVAAGKITQTGADALNARLDEAEAQAEAGQIQRALNTLDTFVSVAKKASTTDDKATREQLAFKGRELKDWLKTFK